jgi:activator of HSP90 ATPase
MAIHQEVTINKPPKAVYEMLTQGKKFEALGGGAAKISAKPGGAISLFDGYATGFNVELVPGKRVVQAWRASDWPKGVWSIVTFQMKKDGKGTALTLDQVGHPQSDESSLFSGWHDFYWKPMNG